MNDPDAPISIGQPDVDLPKVANSTLYVVFAASAGCKAPYTVASGEAVAIGLGNGTAALRGLPRGGGAGGIEKWLEIGWPKTPVAPGIG